MIEFRDLTKLYPQTHVGLGPISAKIPNSQWVSILGPSGSGKSTLLKLLAGIEARSGGELLRGFQPEEMSFVFQESALLPWQTVSDNILLPFRLRGVSLEEAQAKIEPWVQKLKLKKFIHSYPHELSGGLKMRVSLARALSTDPKLLLLDEPFSSLDEPIRIELGIELRELWKALKPTIVMVTHSITEALWLSDRVLVLNGQPGQIALDQQISLGEDRPLALRGEKTFLNQVENCFHLLRSVE